MSSTRVGIAGWGAVTAAGVGTAALCRALEDSSWRAELHLEHPDLPPLPVAACGAFQAREHLPPMVARRLDRSSRLLTVAAREAMTCAGESFPWERATTGVSVGTFNAGTDALLEVLKPVFLGNPDEAPPAQFPSTVANAAASQLGILEKLEGPNLTFAEKQSGGLRALIAAVRMLRSGRASAMITGGVDEAQWLHAECLHRLGELGIEGAPLWGEGAGALLLSCTGASPPRALLAGWGEGSTPCDPFRYPSRPESLFQAVASALDRAELHPRDLDLVISLDNGSDQLAELELEALDMAFQGCRPAVLSVSDRLGEGGFAGAVRAVVAAQVLSGECHPRWPAPTGLAAAGFRPLSTSPQSTLVTTLAAGGSALAVILRRP